MFGRNKPQNEPLNEPSDMTGAMNAANRQNAENSRLMAAVAREYLRDRRSRRRWGYFFKGLIAVYLLITLAAWYVSRDVAPSGPHTALVELEGLIAPQNTSADEINETLRRAFRARDSAGVVLRINSPGGTPVQAAQINAEIRRLRASHPDKPFYVVISDICASGGYYIAVAADEIYAHPSSLVGSIGVRMDSFGFVDALDKLGIERRLVTAGENKGMLDPFSPLEPDQLRHAESMIREVHQQFIDAVKTGRGDRLVEDADLFSGLYWSGERALELGLVDAFGSVGDVARDVIGAREVVTYNPKRSLLDQFAREMGAAVSSHLWGGGLQLR
jgi:protease-4